MRSQRRLVISVLTILSVSGLTTLLVANTPRVAVVVHNRASVSSGILREAKAIVDRIYADAGVHLDWFDITPNLKTVQVDGTKVHVLIVPKQDSAHFKHTRDAVGFTPASGPSYGRLAYILEHRVMAVSHGYSILPAVVLGAAMAHELGHMLLSTGHARAGVMRAEMNQSHLRRIAIGGLGFTPSQALDLQARLSRHVAAERTTAVSINR
jgi:hypothetical protein